MITPLLRRNCLLILLFSCSALLHAQTAKVYTRADSLRGFLNKERTWWNVLRYDISVTPDYLAKSISGKNTITYKVVNGNNGTPMQIDLKDPLVIDSIVYNGRQKLAVTKDKDGTAWHVSFPSQIKDARHRIDIYYGGKVHEAARPPWDGGWSFTKDSLGRPWMTVTCQGAVGASMWYPCKDHQSDEPDLGASLAMTVPDTLMAVANGRMLSKKTNNNGTATYKWGVVNPISNYCIIPYIGKYVNFTEKYKGEKGPLDLSYWVIDYNYERAKTYMPPQVHNMLNSFEYWFGPYPFYEDGYKLIDAPNSGMEHQSAVSYGNKYKFGYGGRDGSGTGWGMKWDFIIVHESGHEWFGNNLTTNDLADMWVHEGFTNYSETLFVDRIFGKEAADAYNHGIRRGIRNDRPVIPAYNVNAQGSGDMYPKPSNMLHSIRHGLNNDSLFRKILRGLGSTYYHKTVNSSDVEQYISRNSKYDYSKVFDQYLRTTQIPKLEYYFSDNERKMFYRWTNAVSGFNLPVLLNLNGRALRFVPSAEWASTDLTNGEAALITPESIEKMYYVKVEKTTSAQ
ncbi:M1 family metallopeptidase [Sediminibacterium roseum]|uniref:M1 family metallopeptidase n=1 Tax=Sediminibacterium roseum TaxID=1978412 RepID=A0ABW9ZYT5_9BACT|nr:M1 family metallopeptidase [Sediminibacterium roseum]NCI51409.1 M1 family metallopeptidase [Sediminibacterium roseum]